MRINFSTTKLSPGKFQLRCFKVCLLTVWKLGPKFHNFGTCSDVNYRAEWDHQLTLRTRFGKQFLLVIAPCKGIQDSLGFWITCCGFRIPGTGFRIPAQWIPDSKKRWIPFFSGFNSFLRTLFSCSNLAIEARHNKFVFFFDLQNY